MSAAIKVERIQDYLDNAILFWRNKQLQAQTLEEQAKAIAYQDAFQVTRSTLLGSMLPIQ